MSFVVQGARIGFGSRGIANQFSIPGTWISWRSTMRTRFVMIAMLIVVVACQSAWPQQKKPKSPPKATGKRAASQAGGPRAALPDAAQDRERAIFKEWAKAIRESVDASKKINKKQAQRDAWAVKTAKAKEDKIRTRYRLSSYQLFLIIKRGVAEKWPTDKPEDLAIVEPIVAHRQAVLDSTIFEEELNAWVAAHTPSTAGRMTGLVEFSNDLLSSGARAAELRKNAPVNLCGFKLPDETVCPRKVVGPAGRRCYEHRDPEKDATK